VKIAVPAFRRGAHERHGGSRPLLIAAAVVLAVSGVLAALFYNGSGLNDRRAAFISIRLARRAARSFLGHFMAADGRVVRRDQGGDTVSEGQAYAMLIAVALDDPHQFALAWNWDREHLQLPDGLFAWHWANGAVLSHNSATDADLDTAWALLLGARRFHDPAYRSQALRVGAGILANETATVGTSLVPAPAPMVPDPTKSVLVAGPWARYHGAVADPSYDSPEALAALGAATSEPQWSRLDANSVSLLQLLELGRSAQLPPNWVVLDSGGTVHAAATPSSSGQPVYGLDAQRVLVWMAASCSSEDKRLAATAWPVLQRSHDNGGAIAYTLAGRRPALAVSPLGFVAAAAAADAAGARQASSYLLNEASAQAASTPTYYGDAWVALGRVLLDTNWLSPCAPSGPVGSNHG
jgi:endoglucanase